MASTDATEDHWVAFIWLQQRLDLLDRTIVKMKQLRIEVATDEDKRAIDGHLAELNMAFAHAKTQYEVAKMGASQLSPPDPDLIKEVKRLSDAVNGYTAANAAARQGMQIAGQVFDLMKKLAV